MRLATSAGADEGRPARWPTTGRTSCSVDDFWVDIPPSEGYLLICENQDRPGMVGAVGTLLGEFDVNISFMNVGRHEKRGPPSWC